MPAPLISSDPQTTVPNSFTSDDTRRARGWGRDDSAVDGFSDDSSAESSSSSSSSSASSEEDVQPHQAKPSTGAEGRCEEEGFEEEACQGCGSTDDPDATLLCDGCDAAWHMACCRPPITAVPSGDWFCPVCVAVDSGAVHPGSSGSGSGGDGGKDTARGISEDAAGVTHTADADSGATKRADILCTICGERRHQDSFSSRQKRRYLKMGGDAFCLLHTAGEQDNYIVRAGRGGGYECSHG